MPRSVVSIAATIAFAWLLAATPIGFAQPATEPTQPDRIDNLIALLGHPQYRQREKASRDLETLGMEAKPALIRASQQTPDPEIRLRCEKLIPRIDFNFCWEYAKVAFGDALSERADFDDLYEDERELWFAFVSRSDDFGKQYADRVRTLIAPPPVRRVPGGQMDADPSRSRPTEGSLGTLLLLGAGHREPIPRDSLQTATILFTRKWGGRYAALKDTPPRLRNSYVLWAENVAPLPIEYEGDKKLERARTALRSSSVPARDRQTALLTVAKAKDKQDDDLIRGFLTDDAVCDTLFTKGVKTQVQLRDIALAATIYRAGKDPSEFGFKNLKPDPDLLFRPSSLGFAAEEDRAEAFRAWSKAAGSPGSE